ncbi:nucleoid-associated protein [Solitalea sp. MAHUQ-68]|uniref:Nucleoid-associated protein n=1 Tax=Solitalea agri TaxID=2953739 RepID=A0A9X2FCZ4_9SPHI|nr:nucleoid-associated protein [Solitalea agri]MCO4294583.1 nucleoid-associated protein [Solitalea agri]
MIHVADVNDLQYLTIHKVGNPSKDEPLVFSKAPIDLSNEDISRLLLNYFIHPFANNGEYYHLYHAVEIALNDIYVYISRIFEDKSTFQEQSFHIAKHLHDSSSHPKIKGGELYIAYFNKCLIDGEEVEAIGIFKSETKETYLKVYLHDDNYEVNYEDGINISKLDKGCLIFNIDKENGYRVSIIDALSKQNEAVYWKDDFLKVKRREDTYLQTENYVDLCTSFINTKLTESFDVSRADQIDLLNKSANYFKEKERFDFDEFTEEVILQPAVIETFKEFKSQFETNHELSLPDSFEISNQAFKKQSKIFKSILKLDKNFHVYIHGRADMIEKGFDDATGLNYYKLFFKEEA